MWEVSQIYKYYSNVSAEIKYSELHIFLLLLLGFLFKVKTAVNMKTFRIQVYNMNSENSELALVKLTELFNHSSVAITKRYLGLRQRRFWRLMIVWHSDSGRGRFLGNISLIQGDLENPPAISENSNIESIQYHTFLLILSQFRASNGKEDILTKRCYWNNLSFSNLANLKAVKMIAISSHTSFTRYSLLS